MTDLHNSYANARDKNIDLDVTPVIRCGPSPPLPMPGCRSR